MTQTPTAPTPNQPPVADLNQTTAPPAEEMVKKSDLTAAFGRLGPLEKTNKEQARTIVGLEAQITEFGKNGAPTDEERAGLSKDILAHGENVRQLAADRATFATEQTDLNATVRKSEIVALVTQYPLLAVDELEAESSKSLTELQLHAVLLQRQREAKPPTLGQSPPTGAPPAFRVDTPVPATPAGSAQSQFGTFAQASKLYSEGRISASEIAQAKTAYTRGDIPYV